MTMSEQDRLLRLVEEQLELELSRGYFTKHDLREIMLTIPELYDLDDDEFNGALDHWVKNGRWEVTVKWKGEANGDTAR